MDKKPSRQQYVVSSLYFAMGLILVGLGLGALLYVVLTRTLVSFITLESGMALLLGAICFSLFRTFLPKQEDK
jgi:hypothetical protein